MIPYIVYLVFLFICVFLDESYRAEKQKLTLLKLALVPYFVLMVFKDASIGSDTPDYFMSFEAMAKYDFYNFLSFEEYGYERIEKGFKLLIWLLTRITPDGHILLLVTAVISSVAIFSFIKDHATNKSLALFFFITLGFFQFAMSGIRQTIAISIIIFGLHYLRKKKLLKYSIVVLLAMQFHKSALFALPLYFVADLEINRKTLIRMIVACVVLYFAGDMLLLEAAELTKYNYGIEQTENGIVFFIIVLLITVLGVSKRFDLLKAKTSNRLVLNANYISLALWALRLVSRTAERVTLYYMPYTYVVLEQYLSTRKNNKILFIILAMAVSTFLFIRRISRDSDFNEFSFYFNLW